MDRVVVVGGGKENTGLFIGQHAAAAAAAAIARTEDEDSNCRSDQRALWTTAILGVDMWGNI